MKKKILKILIYILPFTLGTIGFYFIDQNSFLDSIFNSTLLYIFGYTDSPNNFLVEIARWLAPAVTASWILLLFNTLHEQILHFIYLCTGKSIAVYGPEDEKNALISEIKAFAIDGKDRFVQASKYILLDDEETNFAFYNANKAQLKDHPVYLKSQFLSSNSISDGQLNVFCAEETSARLFWKEHFLYPLSQKLDHKIDVVLIGFGKLGEELLTFGLQNNIFSPDQIISYHIFGDGSRFEATHTSLGSISDPVVFYKEPWYLHLELIEHASMVIVVTQEQQTQLLQELLFATKREDIHVFSANMSSTPLLAGKERLQIFDWKTKSQKLDYILNDTLYKRAKQINLRYTHLYSDVPETKENMDKEWMKLDTFTRYSNISSADYHEIRLKMLECEGIQNTESLSANALELHAELEHIRWCRYHYLNNWTYGIPSNGKNKDKTLRIHKDLVPYQTLTDSEKEKDRENVRLLHSIHYNF